MSNVRKSAWCELLAVDVAEMTRLADADKAGQLLQLLRGHLRARVVMHSLAWDSVWEVDWDEAGGACTQQEQVGN